MKGLDDYITGKNDPSAPFNQTDIFDRYGDVIDFCTWLPESALDNDDIYKRVFYLLDKIVDSLKDKDKWYSQKDTGKFINDNAYLIAQLLEKKYEKK